MSLSKSKCWYSNNCLHFLKCAAPLSLCRVMCWASLCLTPGHINYDRESFIAHDPWFSEKTRICRKNIKILATKNQIKNLSKEKCFWSLSLGRFWGFCRMVFLCRISSIGWRNDNQHNAIRLYDIQHTSIDTQRERRSASNNVVLSVVISLLCRVSLCYAECRFAMCRRAECRGAVCFALH